MRIFSSEVLALDGTAKLALTWEEIAEMLNEREQLKEQTSQLKSENEKLKAEIEELKEEIKVLEKFDER